MSNKLDNPQKEEVKNMMVAMVLVTLIFFGFNYMNAPTKQSAENSAVVETIQSSDKPTEVIEGGATETAVQEVVVQKTEPVTLENEYVKASFDAALGGITDLSLLKYKESIEDDSKKVQLFNNDYFTNLMWQSKDVNLPHLNSLWVLNEEASTPTTKVFVFSNADVKIERIVSLDDKYMFSITDKVYNLKDQPIKVYQQGSFERKMDQMPPVSTVHQGFVGFLNDELVEEKYADKPIIYSGRSSAGWFGLTDKYWQGLMVLGDDETVAVTFSSDKDKKYTARFETDNILIPAQGNIEKKVMLFAGAKDIDVINDYQKSLNIKHFDLSLDFGWFRFLTQPFLHFLNYLYSLIGNMGVAIIVFATLIRFAMLPIATKSYESMAKMRKVQPKLKQIQTRFKDDPRRLQMEMANLYKREKINPASGCLPLLLQIPVFFALYKVLSISINMRQAPFFGWIEDLSMPDPLTIFNGFGYFDWNVPAFLCIGIWPILMGITMYVQQKLSPTPTTDNAQAKMMQFLPVIFTLMMASFASGLIIYWTWSNVLSIIQQKYIMKKVGVN